ncbi:hypothetical protein Tco_0598393 [Tanacetum coccineum]
MGRPRLNDITNTNLSIKPITTSHDVQRIVNAPNVVSTHSNATKRSGGVFQWASHYFGVQWAPMPPTTTTHRPRTSWATPFRGLDTRVSGMYLHFELHKGGFPALDTNADLLTLKNTIDGVLVVEDLNVNFSSLGGELFQDPNVNFSSLGDLRYASYSAKDGIGKFPDVEAFQCYDKVKAVVKNYGKPK